MRPRPPYYMTTPERAAGDIKAMLLSIERNAEGELEYRHFSQIQREIRQGELASLLISNPNFIDINFLRDRRETDMASLARATRAYFDPTALIDYRSGPSDYRQVEGYWEMIKKINQDPEFSILSVGELFRLATRHRNGKIPMTVRRVLLFDKNHQSQFSK